MTCPYEMRYYQCSLCDQICPRKTIEFDYRECSTYQEEEAEK